MIIGLILLVPFTIYLFIFYSSTFYSAFFRNAESLDGLANAMFDAQAITHALEGGWYELAFVLLAPVIFLALGFLLHFFFEEKSKIKYLKVVGILAVALFFDSILAYKIGEQLHNFGIIIGTIPIGMPYGINAATQDINTWAVIFCGFIAYIIWGFVFDLIMTAYNNMDTNKVRLKQIKVEIQDFKKDIENYNAEIQGYQQQITDLKNEKSLLNAQLVRGYIIDLNAIRTEIANFFAGWTIQMKTLNSSEEDLNKAKETYHNFINTLIVD